MCLFHPVWIIISLHLFFPLKCCSLASLPLKEKPQETPNTPLFSKKPNASFELASYKAAEKLTGRTPRSNNFLGHPQCNWPGALSNLLLAALRNGFLVMQVPNNFLEPLCGPLCVRHSLAARVQSVPHAQPSANTPGTQSSTPSSAASAPLCPLLLIPSSTVMPFPHFSFSPIKFSHLFSPSQTILSSTATSARPSSKSKASCV